MRRKGRVILGEGTFGSLGIEAGNSNALLESKS